MKLFTKEAKIGITGIVAVTILFFGIRFLKGINMLNAMNYYYVEFENIGGLTVSSPVYANGYNLGIVRNITYNYNSPNHVVVKVEVDNQFRLPKGSRGELNTEMLGTTKMNLILDKESTAYHQPGDTIPGRVNGGLMDEAATLVPALARILPKLDSIAASLNALLADPALSNTLHHTEQVTANLQTATNELNRMMKNDLQPMAGNLNTVSENFVTISDNLKQADYASTMRKADSTMQNILLLTDKLNRKDNTLGLLFNDTTVYHNLDATTRNAASLLDDLKSHPKRYVHFSIFGKKEK